MTDFTKTHTIRKFCLLLAVIILNSFLLFQAFKEPKSLLSQASKDKPDSAKREVQREVEQSVLTEQISIEVVQMPQAQPKVPVDPPEPEVKPPSITPNENLIAQNESQQKNENSEPRLVGKVDIDYFELERMVESTGGAIFLYDLNIKRPVRQIKRGVLVSLSQAPTSLSVVSHNITDELEQLRVFSWAEEQRLFNPSGSFVVVAKFPASFQHGFEQLAQQIARELNLEYKSVDEVRFQFTQQGLVINQLKIDDKLLDVNRAFSD